MFPNLFIVMLNKDTFMKINTLSVIQKKIIDNSPLAHFRLITIRN